MIEKARTITDSDLAYINRTSKSTTEFFFRCAELAEQRMNAVLADLFLARAIEFEPYQRVDIRVHERYS